jgi:DNA-binding MarR family transcriptional regulator/predicted transcriptional regulator
MGTSKTILLTRADAACLDAIRAGAGRQNLIALQTKLTLKDAAASIAKLAAAGLVIRQQRYCWEATRRGKGALVTIVANPERSRGGKRFGEIRPGTSSDRLIALLDDPRRGTELAKELGISSQRVHQLVIRLVALGFLRVGDERHPLRIVCRADDHSVLLRIAEERVLSSLSQGGATTVGKIAIMTRMTRPDVNASIQYLMDRRLVRQEGVSKHGELFILTPAGADHPQRRRTARRADLPPLPVRSERVREVLAYLVREGPTRTRDVGVNLRIPLRSINALMQYLKRKGLVRKSDAALNAPHEVTDHGRKTLANMNRSPMDLAA